MPMEPRAGHWRIAATGAWTPLVGFRVARLEPLVGGSVFLLALWMIVFERPDGPLPWVVAGTAAAIGAWSRRFPAQHVGLLLLRGALLLGGGAMLAFDPQFGGPAANGWLWLLLAATGYALLMPWGAGVLMLVAAVAVFILGWRDAGLGPWRQAMVHLGALALLPALAVAMGRMLRASEQRAEQARVDPGSRLYNEEGFFEHGAALFDECVRERKPFTLVLLNAADLRDAGELLGRRAANELFAQTVRALATVARSTGIAARTDTVEFAIALPGIAVERADELLHQELGRPAQVRLAWSGADAVIVLDAVSAQAPPDLHTLEELYDRLHQQLTKRVEDTIVSGLDKPPSTLQGLLLQDPPMAASQRPTLPMPLSPRRLPPSSRRAGRGSRPAPLHPR